MTIEKAIQELQIESLNNVSLETLKIAYRQAVKSVHPDEIGQNDKIYNINAAYETLKDFLESSKPIEKKKITLSELVELIKKNDNSQIENELVEFNITISYNNQIKTENVVKQRIKQYGLKYQIPIKLETNNLIDDMEIIIRLEDKEYSIKMTSNSLYFSIMYLGLIPIEFIFSKVAI